MGFEIKPKKSLEKNLRKLVKSQVDKAASSLRGEDDLPVSEVVHEVRKRFKRIRALARLARNALGEEVADRLNHGIRDASRPLSGSRDANVLVKSLDNLAERWTPSERPEVFATVREILEARHQETRREAIEDGDVFATVLDAMMDAHREFKRSDFSRGDWNSLAEGLTRMYGKCVEANRVAQEENSDENMHAWRKRVKDLLYEFKVLRPVRPWYFQRLERQADELGELLGEDHDLAVLREFLASEPTCAGSIDAIVSTLDERRHVLQAAAFSQAPAMLGECPDAFDDRIRAYWKAWRAEVKAAEFDRSTVGQEG